MMYSFLSDQFRLFFVILLLISYTFYANGISAVAAPSTNTQQDQEQAEFLELEIEKIKQDLNSESENFKEWLETEGSVFYVWSEKNKQHISAMPPPWYRNSYYPAELQSPCVTVYRGVQMIDNSCIKSHLINDQKIFNAHQSRQRYYQLKIELEKREQELKSLVHRLKVKLGMSQKLVEMIWGKYDEGLSVGEDFGETWLYKNGRWVTFQNGKVEKFQDMVLEAERPNQN